MWFLSLLLALGSCAFSTNGYITSCQPVLGKDSLRPAVCGKCHIEVKDGKLLITPAEDCPAYQVYKCTTREGKTFFINTLGCRPYEERN